MQISINTICTMVVSFVQSDCYSIVHYYNYDVLHVVVFMLRPYYNS